MNVYCIEIQAKMISVRVFVCALALLQSDDLRFRLVKRRNKMALTRWFVRCFLFFYSTI